MICRILVIAMQLMAVLGLVGTTLGAGDDIDTHRDCLRCGMDRKAYGYSRMLVVYEDGAEAGVCSLHCAVEELDAATGRRVKSLLVADRKSRKLIDAEKGVWVIGGTKRGVMTQRAKWAFAAGADAQEFIDAYGGKIASWDEALAAAREDASPKPR